MKEIEKIDLFAGIGGFRYGLEKINGGESNRRVWQEQIRSGKENLRQKRNSSDNKQSNGDGRGICASNNRFKCVWSNEWDKYARQIYKKHWGKCDGRDIRTIPTGEIPDHDLLCAGFPCQSFSIAGKRGGFDDTRGTLFFEIARILTDKRPRYFLLENVKGLLSHQEGKTFQTIIGVLSDLGYGVEWQVLNSKHFGVPQNRERVFIVGHLGGESGFQVFPLKESSKGNLHYLAGVVSAREKWIKGDKNYSREFSQGQGVYSDKGIAQTLADNAGGLGGKTGLYQVGDKGASNYLDSNYHKGWLTHGQRTMIVEQMKIRKLTPTECERLQGFPDDWTGGISDTQRYKCLGNAVTTNVITAIGNKFIRIINECN